ncbi:hypothetical protein ACJJTC_001864 [Scirpophaga incertulas]
MAKRREWMDDLKQPKKKAKVKILNQKIYVGGKLIASTENTNSNITEAPNEDCEDSYIKETNEVLKKITPCKPSFCEQMSIQNKENYFKEDLYSHYYNFNPNQCQLLSNDSSILLAQSIDPLSNLGTNYGEVQSPIKGQVTDILSLVPETNTSVCEDPAAGVPRSPSPAPGTNTGFLKDRAANILRSFSRSLQSPSPSPGKSTKKQKRNNFPRQCKRKLEFNKAYLDFLGDDADDNLLNEVFSSEDSGSWSEQETSSESDKDESQPNVKKTKKGKKSKITKKPEIKRINIEKSKPKFLIKKENNIRRQNGKSYFNGKGNHIEAKKMKLNPCIRKKCRNGCGEILEDRRQALLQFFWNLQNQQRRKDWITQITVQKPVKKCTINTANTSRRGVTYEYYINDGEERRKVCQQFLIATLDISQRFILYTAETTIDGFAKLDDMITWFA